MNTFLIVMAAWTVIAIFAGWVLAQCIDSMGEPDPIEEETAALLKRINKDNK